MQAPDDIEPKDLTDLGSDSPERAQEPAEDLTAQPAGDSTEDTQVDVAGSGQTHQEGEDSAEPEKSSESAEESPLTEPASDEETAGKRAGAQGASEANAQGASEANAQGAAESGAQGAEEADDSGSDAEISEDSAEASDAAEGAEAEPDGEAESSSEAEVAVAEESLEEQLAERTEDLQRLSAEYANYRRRTERERTQIKDTAQNSVVVRLLPILDDLDLAQQHGDMEGPLKALADKLNAVLRDLNVSAFGAAGDQFNPELHEAVQDTSTGDEKALGVVLRKGYQAGERILRTAMVIVGDPTGQSEGEPD